MARGILRVLLVNGKGLRSRDFLKKMDPYVVLSYSGQQKKSKVARGEGCNPEWNETFVFKISDEASELKLRIMDHDTFSHDDFVGESIIPLDGVFDVGFLPPQAHNVVLRDNSYFGEIKVALKFQPEETAVHDEDDDVFGGYKLGYL
eukprot:TRINITY_DN21081_c0_g1_i1.p1 TRINITY_DN21081_c0_g1~~TRINITY_DN21081_c0_g1_i1.p1  ORF type:complete len:147 (-),score=30.16 TRINITY_DN21081_c0_g1_i1:32-472(-)